LKRDAVDLIEDENPIVQARCRSFAIARGEQAEGARREGSIKARRRGRARICHRRRVHEGRGWGRAVARKRGGKPGEDEGAGGGRKVEERGGKEGGLGIAVGDWPEAMGGGHAWGVAERLGAGCW